MGGRDRGGNGGKGKKKGKEEGVREGKTYWGWG